MELRHLRYFVAVAEHRNFGRAAEALGTAQPSLSKQIRQLERSIGVPLFQRTTRHVQLTPAGEIFLIECQRILSEIGASVDAARAVATGERGLLRTTFVPGAIVGGVLPRFFRNFKEANPGVTLQLKPMPAFRQIELLREGAVDVAFFSSSYRDNDLDQLFVLRERFVLAIPQSHPFATRDDLSYDDLRGQRLLIYARDSGSQLQSAITAVLHAESVEPLIVELGADAETILGLVAAGQGLSIVPQTWQAFAIPGVVYRPVVPQHWLDPGLALFWRHAEPSPITKAFVSSVERSLTSHDESSRPIVS